jgi:hypothetical protein
MPPPPYQKDPPQRPYRVIHSFPPEYDGHGGHGGGHGGGGEGHGHEDHHRRDEIDEESTLFLPDLNNRSSGPGSLSGRKKMLVSTSP